MSRKLVKNDPRALDVLPLFRDTAATDEAAAGEDTYAADGDGEALTGELDAALQSLDESVESAHALPAAPVRPRFVVSPLPHGRHALWVTLGLALMVTGAGLGALVVADGEQSAVQAALQRVGLSPALLLGLGLLASGVGTLLRRQSRQAEDLGRVEATLHDLLGVADQVDAATRALTESDTARAATAMSGDE